MFSLKINMQEILIEMVMGGFQNSFFKKNTSLMHEHKKNNVLLITN